MATNTPYLVHKSGRWAVVWNEANASHPDMRPMTKAQFEEFQKEDAMRVAALHGDLSPKSRSKSTAPKGKTAAPANQELTGGLEDDR